MQKPVCVCVNNTSRTHVDTQCHLRSESERSVKTWLVCADVAEGLLDPLPSAFSSFFHRLFFFAEERLLIACETRGTVCSVCSEEERRKTHLRCSINSKRCMSRWPQISLNISISIHSLSLFVVALLFSLAKRRLFSLVLRDMNISTLSSSCAIKGNPTSM